MEVRDFVLNEEQIEALESSGPLGPTLRLLYDHASTVVYELENDEDSDRTESLKKLVSYTVAVVILTQAIPTIAGAGMLVEGDGVAGPLLPVDLDTQLH
jgi:hypothetical protein